MGDVNRKPDGENAAFAGARAIRLDRAAMQGEKLLDQRQADAEPASRPIEMMVDLREELEDLVLHVHGNADPGVGHGDDHLIALASQRKRDATALGRILRSVVQKIADQPTTTAEANST